MTATGQFEAALQIVRRCARAGYEAYLAGGCVRDLLLGREPADYDVATSATPDVVLEMFPRTFAVGAHFGVVLVAPRWRAGGWRTPALSPRWRRSGRMGRIPMGGIRMRCAIRRAPKRMCERRDFTINGLLLDPLRNPWTSDGRSEVLRSAVIDYVGGLADLDAGVVRAIGRPELRFEEDHLRMLRGVRFAARFGFELEAETKRGDPRAGAAHPRSEPRARARRADQDAHRGPCAAGLRTAGRNRAAARGAARGGADEGRGAAAAVSSRRRRVGAHADAAGATGAGLLA